MVFGPVVRSHAHDLQKKVRRLGLKCALSVRHASLPVCTLLATHVSVYQRDACPPLITACMGTSSHVRPCVLRCWSVGGPSMRALKDAPGCVRQAKASEGRLHLLDTLALEASKTVRP